MKPSILLRIVVAVCVVAVAAVARKPKSGPNVIPSGDLQADVGWYSVVFYYSPDPKVEPKALVESLTKKFLPDVKFAPNDQKAPDGTHISFREEMAPLKDFPVPDASYFKYAGRGMSAEDIEAVRKTSRATILTFFIAKKDVWTMGRKFTEMALEFARQSGAYIWDSATRECFTPDAWSKQRLEAWPAEGIPEIPRQITIHLYQADESSPELRAITLGMEKFGLPEVVVENLVHSDSQGAGRLMNVVCQRLAEQPVVADAEKEEFSISRITNASVRKLYSENVKSGATLKATLALVPGKAQSGDPANRLIELDFRHGAGSTIAEKRQSILSEIWGATDSVKAITHNAELQAASERAKAKLPELRKKFVAGLELGSRLMLKAPFKRDDEGNEWMWIEVLKWPEDGKIQGSLQNDPFYIKKLRAGARVTVEQADIFDYMLYRADGASEGNETGKLIEKQQGEEKER